MRNSLSQKKIILTFLLILISIFVIFISVFIWYLAFSYSADTAVYENAKKNIIKETSLVPSISVSDLEEINNDNNSSAEFVSLLEIDFDMLLDMCPDAIGWLDIPGTSISYPVVQGSDNEIYLSVDAYGNESSLGSIYLNFNNSKDFTDYKSILYGHNMRNGTMFHDLRYYGKLSYAIEHMNAYLYLPDGTIKIYTFITSGLVDCLDLKIYALREEDGVTSTIEYINSLSDSSTNTFTNKNLIILSTCTGREKSRRRVVIFQEL